MFEMLGNIPQKKNIDKLLKQKAQPSMWKDQLHDLKLNFVQVLVDWGSGNLVLKMYIQRELIWLIVNIFNLHLTKIGCSYFWRHCTAYVPIGYIRDRPQVLLLIISKLYKLLDLYFHKNYNFSDNFRRNKSYVIHLN